MKKFVTLSAIALSGATLGVGSAFGWWADDTENAQKTAPETDVKVGEVQDATLVVEKPVVEKAEIRSADGLLRITQDQNGAAAELVEIKLGLPDNADGKKPEDVRASSDIVRQLPDNTSEIRKLADQLEQEAKQLDDQGQKEAAAAQRKIIQRLRETIKKSAASRDVLFWRKSGEPKAHIVLADEPIEVRDVKVRLAEAAGQARRAEDQAVRQKIEAEIQALHARLHQLNADKQVRFTALKDVKVRALNDENNRARTSESYQLVYRDDAKIGHLDQVRQTLRDAADRLEKEGRQDEARALREHAEHVMRALQKSKTDTDDARRDARKRLEIRLQEEKARQHRTEKGDDHDPRVRNRDVAAEAQRHIAIVGVGDAHLAELHKQLHELRHEIGELRADIRKLHKQLKSDRREKEDEDDDEDEDQDRGEKEDAKKEVSDKSSAAKDYLKVYTGIINDAGEVKALDLGINLNKVVPDTQEKSEPQP